MKEIRKYSEQLRALTDNEGRKYIEGYAAVFNQKSKLLFENGKEFYEIIENGAFDDVLQLDELDVRLTYQHDLNIVIARHNRARNLFNLILEVDDYGLKYRAYLPNTSLANDLFELIQRGDIYENSFFFTVSPENETWDISQYPATRFIKKVSGLFDVSIVIDGAYAGTDLQVAFRRLSEINENIENEKRAKEIKEEIEKDKKIIERMKKSNVNSTKK